MLEFLFADTHFTHTLAVLVLISRLGDITSDVFGSLPRSFVRLPAEGAVERTSTSRSDQAMPV
jgi:hypothetical protein